MLLFLLFQRKLGSSSLNSSLPAYSKSSTWSCLYFLSVIPFSYSSLKPTPAYYSTKLISVKFILIFPLLIQKQFGVIILHDLSASFETIDHIFLLDTFSSFDFLRLNILFFLPSHWLILFSLLGWFFLFSPFSFWSTSWSVLDSFFFIVYTYLHH